MADVQIAVIDQQNTQIALAAPSETEVTVAVPGVQGPVGEGVPAGGTANQVLFKQSGTDYDTTWGEVTSAMIGDLEIVNADVSASAAIAGTKISPDFGAQNITTSGTATAAALIPSGSSVPTNGVYLPSANNVALSTNGTGRLFVDASGNVGVGGSPTPFGALTVFSSGIGAHINSSSGAAGINFYENGVGRFSLRTLNGSAGLSFYDSFNNTERLRITADGKVGIGSTSDPGGLGSRLWIDTTGDTYFTANSTGSGNLSAIHFRNSNSNGEARILNNTGGALTFYRTSGNEAMRITSDGKVGVGTSSPSQKLDLVQPVYDNVDVFYRSANGSIASVYGASASTYGGNQIVLGSTSNHNLSFVTNNSVRATLDSSGNVLINNASALGKLSVNAAASSSSIYATADNGYALLDAATNASGARFNLAGGTEANGVHLWGYNSARNNYTPLNYGASQHIFKIGSTERARIDSSGRLLVGTSSAPTGTLSANSLFHVRGNTATSAGGAQLNLSSNQTSAALGGWGGAYHLGRIIFTDTQAGEYAHITCTVDTNNAGVGSYPGRLVFSTTADGASSPTEQLRITSDRYVRLASGTGGIQFNGDTAAANALDDYEEGTWTPAFEPTTGAFTSITYGQRVGVYTRVGNICYCHGNFQVASVDTTGASSSLRIAGLPFPISNTYGLVGSFGIAYNFVGTGDYLAIWGNNGDSSVFVSDGTAVAGSAATVQATEIKAGTYIRFSFTYKVA